MIETESYDLSKKETSIHKRYYISNTNSYGRGVSGIDTSTLEH